MNWITNVKGACHLDYMLGLPEERLMEVSNATEHQTSLWQFNHVNLFS